MEELELLLDEYIKKFGETFPTMTYGNDVETVAKKVKECLKTGKAEEIDTSVLY